MAAAHESLYCALWLLHEAPRLGIGSELHPEAADLSTGEMAVWQAFPVPDWCQLEGDHMYRVNVRRHFDSAHALRGYNGRCENLHGHRWEIVVCAQREDLDDLGLSIDFTLLKKELDAILAGFDHRNLNETAPFDQINPSSENIARVVYDRLRNALPGCDLAYVEAWESPDAWATYSEV